ncbi:MAG: RHS repeat-associated core domain-containing protein, partial [bacterium]|nr:RHS repeat-associated core domain-containing protein [bacterium]
KSAEVVLPTSMHTLFAFIHVLFLTPLLVAPLLAVGWWLARRAHWPLPGNLTMQGSTHGARGLTRHNRAVAGWAHRNPMDYTPFGRELALSVEAKTTPEGYTGKPLDLTFGLQAMNYGARFYDPRLGRWWQRDPLAEEYASISPYLAMNNNPVSLVDPDGRSTQVLEDGTVVNVFDDGSLDINMWLTGQNSSYLVKVGETEYYDEFMDGKIPSGRIRLGEDWNSALAVGLDLGSKLNHFGLAVLSGHKGVLDLKTRSDIAPDGPYTGRLLNGKYISARSLGNYVFGKNCYNSGATWEETIYPITQENQPVVGSSGVAVPILLPDAECR